MGISHHLLLFISLLSLTRAQTTQESSSQTSRMVTLNPTTFPDETSYQWPEHFYPFISASSGNTLTHFDNKTSKLALLSSPFLYFGRHYYHIYVNSNGVLSFSREMTGMSPFPFPFGGEDLIAPLWTDLDGFTTTLNYYEDTSEDVLTRATQDVNRYFPGLSFRATWVFVATWDIVQTVDPNVMRNSSHASIAVQVVLISDGSHSFILMNYADVDVMSFQVEAGYDTIGSTHYFVIPDSTDGNLLPNFQNTSNVNVQGRWAFSANQGLLQFAQSFYPVGLAAGDTQTSVFNGESFATVSLSNPFLYFGRTYNLIYVNSNGLLSFSGERSGMSPWSLSNGTEDLIAPLWTDLDSFGLGFVYYHEYTSGDVLRRATDDIKHYYPGLSFSANWVFVTTWDFVQTFDSNVFYPHSAPTISVQVVLISDGSHSFILMNYGDVAAFGAQMEAGYGTLGSTHYFVMPDLTDGNLVPNLQITTNVQVQGRWAFSANPSLVQFAESFYPVGLAAGDTETVVSDDIHLTVALSSPFMYFERAYNVIYVNNNGLLSFSQAIPEMEPSYGGEDFIAPLWTDLDDYGLGALNYHEYTSGDVLTRATRDINQHFPAFSFNATWVFVATWDFVNTWDANVFLHHSAPSLSAQVVLISDGSRSFILMNYGDIAPQMFSVKAGYDTVGSIHNYVIPGSNDWNLVPNLKNTSNVNVPGRWAFMASAESVAGLQMKVTSYLDLTDGANLAYLLDELKNELVIRGLSSDVKLSTRRVEKKTP